MSKQMPCTGILHTGGGKWVEWWALKMVFRQWLNDDIHQEMVCRDYRKSLDSLIDLAILLPSPKEMQLGRTRLSPTEKERRRCRALYMYWSNSNHQLSQCTQRPNHQPLKTAQESSSTLLPLAVSNTSFTFLLCVPWFQQRDPIISKTHNEKSSDG